MKNLQKIKLISILALTGILAVWPNPSLAGERKYCRVEYLVSIPISFTESVDKSLTVAAGKLLTQNGIESCGENADLTVYLYQKKEAAINVGEIRNTPGFKKFNIKTSRNGDFSITEKAARLDKEGSWNIWIDQGAEAIENKAPFIIVTKLAVTPSIIVTKLAVTPSAMPKTMEPPASGSQQDIVSGIQNILNCANPVDSSRCTAGKLVFNRPNNAFKFGDMGDLISSLLNVGFSVAIMLTFLMMIWGAFQYLLAQGDKAGLAKARARLIWAIIGLMFTLISFALTQFIEQILKPTIGSPLSLFVVNTIYAEEPTPITVNIKENFAFGQYDSIAELFNTLFPSAIAIAGIISLAFFIMSALQILMSGGNKDSISKARNRITHTAVALIILISIFLVLPFLLQYFGIEFKLF